MNAPLAFSRLGKLGGPTLVFLHGFLGCKEDWHEIVEPLIANYDILLIDLPGHGASTAVDDELFTFDGCVGALANSLASQGIRSCAVVGYSMGGRITMHFACSPDSPARSVVLIGAHPGIESELARAARLLHDRQLAEQLVCQPLDRFIDSWYQQSMFDSLRASPAYGQIRKRRTSGDPTLLSKALTGLSVGRQAPHWLRLKKSGLPLRYIAGELDTKYCEVGTCLANLCPQAKLDIIAGAGHAVHLERPEEVTRVIRSFLATQS